MITDTHTHCAFIQGASIEAKNKYGETALHLAVSRLNHDAVLFLIRMKADTNSPNE